jgi:hypothetical protein
MFSLFINLLIKKSFSFANIKYFLLKVICCKDCDIKENE